MQHKRGSTKPLKATNRRFSFATARKEGRLQVWIEVAHFSSFPCNWMRIKAPDNAWQRALKFRSSIWIYKAWQLRNVLTIRKGKRLNTSCLSSTCREIFVCVLLTSNHMIYYIYFEITGDPCNLIGSQQCDLSTNRTIFYSKSHLFASQWEKNTKTKQQSDFKACLK